MATAGTDYMVTGLKWSNASRITYSIAPDGVYWSHGANSLNAYFNSTLGTNGTWQREIARALATWQSAANINIVQVADGAYDEDTRGSSQGDARFGDIRFGGYAYAGNQTTLAATAFPPPSGWTLAGDVQVNTNLKYKIGGGDYDLYSVMLHETGHSLGLDHVSNKVEVMDGTYRGVRKGLSAGDVAGIQSIYGARQPDMYESQGFGLNSSKPIDMTQALVSANTTTAGSASLAKIGDVEWFSFVAPSYASGSWQATASAEGLSMLSPKITVYDAAGTKLTQASNPSDWGNAVSTSLSAIVPGQRYYVAVTGATGDVFDTGAYQVTVKLSSSPPKSTPVWPPVATTPSPPVTTTPTPTPTPTTSGGPSTNQPVYPSQVHYASPDRLEPNDAPNAASRLGRVAQGTVSNLSLNTASDVDVFTFQAAATGILQISATGTTLLVYNARGKLLAHGEDSVNVSAARNASLIVKLQSPDGSPVESYSLSITPRAPASRQFAVRRAFPRIMARSFPRAAVRLARQTTDAPGPEVLAAAAAAWATAMKRK
jgi:predicted Zn-dependent protease